jgi:hypothetical protein
MERTGNLQHIWEIRNAYNILAEKPQRQRPTGVVGRIKSKWSLEKAVKVGLD